VRLSCLMLATILSLVCLTSVRGDHPLKFKVKLLTVDANEGCDIADFDGDGKLDVVAGRNWYRNGDWLPRPVRLIEDVNGYVHSNGDFAMDVNGNGLPDVVAGTFFNGKVFWYENPGPEKLSQGFLWQPHLLIDTGLGTNEASLMHDLDGSGKPQWITNQWNPTNPLLACRFEIEGEGDAQRHVLVPHKIGGINGHGIGIGDVNNNGRPDILVGKGWYEHPEEGPYSGEWKFHADWDRQLPCPMLVADVNGDGINDIIVSQAHGFGLFLWVGKGPDENGKMVFEEQLIDDSFSQGHALHFADLDGDGKQELITGKRVRAHNGGDPGAGDPPIICYYKWDEKTEKFDRHIINKGEVGIGLQIRTADISGNGALDIVVAGKEGTQILFNQRTP